MEIPERAVVDRESEVWLGLDLGTQSARALAVTASGEVVGAGTQPLTSRRSGVRHEQDPEAWWQAIAAASSEAMQTVPAGAVRGVAVDATSGTIVLVDRKGSPLTPGLMYDDTRATGFVDRINAAGERVWAELGLRPDAAIVGPAQAPLAARRLPAASPGRQARAPVRLHRPPARGAMRSRPT